MLDVAKDFGTKVFFVALGIVLVWAGWQGLVGKALACLISPATLEVVGRGSQSKTADSSTTALS